MLIPKSSVNLKAMTSGLEAESINSDTVQILNVSLCVLKIFYTKITIIFFTLQSTCFAMIIPSRSLVIAQNIFWSKDVTLSDGTPTLNSTISKSVPIVS